MNMSSSFPEIRESDVMSALSKPYIFAQCPMKDKGTTPVSKAMAGLLYSEKKHIEYQVSTIFIQDIYHYTQYKNKYVRKVLMVVFVPYLLTLLQNVLNC